MRLRINHLIDSRTKMLAGLSHDLRTPITRLKLHLQFLPRDNHCEKMATILDDMQKMISTVLDFSTMDGMHEKKVKLDIVALLHSICEDYIDIGHTLEFMHTEIRAIIFGRFIALRRAFTNIIDNAIKYGKRARIALMVVDQHHIEIQIMDEGPGIPSNELKDVFNMYYRSTSTSKMIQGNGLGLSVAYEIISAHEGSVHLANMDPAGLRVVIKLPIRLNTS